MRQKGKETVRRWQVRFRWQEFDPFFDGSGRLIDGPHFDPMAEQHNVDQRGQFLKEDFAGQTTHHGAGVKVRHGNSQGDQRYHIAFLKEYIL